MSYLNWYVGMKVVCVDDRWDDRRSLAAIAAEAIPTAGAIYTVREIGLFYPPKPKLVCVRLNEIENPVKRYCYTGGIVETERCFAARRFRPLETRETDISIFTQMLNPSKVNVGEPA